MPTQQAAGQHKLKLAGLTSRAKELRRSDTLAEKLAWGLLRNRQLLRYKFRRQVPLGAVIVDFCCLSLKLVVELDGAGLIMWLKQRGTGCGTRSSRKRVTEFCSFRMVSCRRHRRSLSRKLASASPSWNRRG